MNHKNIVKQMKRMNQANCSQTAEMLAQLHLIKIKGGEIKSYYKTYWETLYMTIDLIVKSKPILENHISVISNTAVFDLLEDEDFYIKYHQVFVILKPIKKLTNCLEARTANLADIFIDEITNNDGTNNLNDINKSEILESLILNIADSVDLMLPEFLASGDAIFSSEPITNWARDIAVGNMNYNSIKLAHQMVL
ncbi:23723_t:CDS:2 [Dentiscutata erythropus]|uniref:23723_t:CDS:1 n=1 Tax=Dentiscutata erythropus TaxID=1348616 RepID=A0A9N9BXZ5_9GLOM|nr:23723_t:CDS:2 [Dentiscutata erythropus]